MHYMNDYEIERALETALRNDLPVMTEAVYRLIKLYNWTNSNSDGWAYWPKPVRAADKLMTLIESVDPFAGGMWGDEADDLDPADLKRALTPIKSFLTRQGVDHSVVFDGTTFESIGQ
jgi:hypothetical protein